MCVCERMLRMKLFNGLLQWEIYKLYKTKLNYKKNHTTNSHMCHWQAALLHLVDGHNSQKLYSRKKRGMHY